MKILVSGSLAYDRIMDYPGRFRDSILPNKIHALNVSFAVADLRESFGGTAGNIAYNLALLGNQPVVVAAAGKDFSSYRQWLQRHGVDVRAIRRVAGEPTASVTIITDRDDNQIAGFYVGAMRAATPLPPSVKAATYAIVAPGNLSDMRTLPGRYAKLGVPYLYDPGQQLPVLTGTDLRRAIHRADGLVSNDYELSLIQRKTGWEMSKLRRATKYVITTLGPRGSVVRMASQIIRVPAVKASRVIDPTGAGDAYRAGWVTGWLRHWPLDVAARFAGCVAVYAVEQAGTQVHQFTFAQVATRYRRAFGRPLPK